MDKNQHLDDLFRAAREQEAVHSFGDTKKHFLSSIQANDVLDKIQTKSKSYFTLKNLIIMITTVSSIALAVFLFLPSKEEKVVSKETKVIINSSKSEGKITDNYQEQQSPIKSIFSFDPISDVDTFDNVKKYSPDLTWQELDFSLPINTRTTKPYVPNSDEYIFPKLTEEEIALNNKQKKEMLKELEKFDKKVYAYIPSGTFDFKGKTASVQSFYMQKTEVSNLEYRTFLFDLLIQGRKDEFLKAKPDQNQWSLLPGGENNKLKDHYFSHPAYDHYPVVNVSREGAEIYCKWLTHETNKVLESKNKDLINDVRIPAREEWSLAASSGGTKSPYPWGGPFMRNSEGLFEANFRMTLEEYESLPAEPSDLTAPVESYWSNDYGLYNMSGNVAEMVYNDINLKTVGTAGGGWSNTAEELKIYAPDPFEGKTDANPAIGFRVVITYIKQ